MKLKLKLGASEPVASSAEASPVKMAVDGTARPQRGARVSYREGDEEAPVDDEEEEAAYQEEEAAEDPDEGQARKRKRGAPSASPVTKRRQTTAEAIFGGDSAAALSVTSTNTTSSTPQIQQPQSFVGFSGGEDEEDRPINCLQYALKKDHPSRPLYIAPNRIIYMENFSPIAEQAQDFLVAIAEPVSRPSFVHEYRLTPYSLYAAVSVGLETKDILDVLERLSKTKVPEEVVRFVKENTLSFGKVKLVLKQNRYYVESVSDAILRKLLKDPEILASVVHGSANVNMTTQPDGDALVEERDAPSASAIEIAGFKQLAAQRALAKQQAAVRKQNAPEADSEEEEEGDGAPPAAPVAEDDDMDGEFRAGPDPSAILLASQMMEKGKSKKTINEEEEEEEMNHGHGRPLDDDDTDDEDVEAHADREDADGVRHARQNKVHAFEIETQQVETVRKRCRQLDYPMMEEYDFHNDDTIPDLKIDLKSSTVIRPYQERSLSKMFGNGRARSGIIVLPCGAGKTLVGITAACTIKKPTLVLCTSAVSVEQWRQQFKLWTDISDAQIAKFTSEHKEIPRAKAAVVVSTYTMVAFSGNRSHESNRFMEYLRETEWGFLLLDEAHVTPANVFRKILTDIAAHAKLGLTATLLREDTKIDDLNFLIGPKLYEANWLDLSRKGHIANVQCAEVWCDMTPEFYAEYLKTSSRKRRLIYVMNPNKFQACQFLINYHEKRGEKTIVFSDDVFALQKYAKTMGKYYIYGATGQQERMDILNAFKNSATLNTIFLSKVGDTSIDLPEATCLIQISSHYGSRRQEAQRLGRILRAKRRSDEGFNAYFYSLVSRDTQEMYYSAKRQQFLVDQGYAFKVIETIPPKAERPHLLFHSESEQRSLLQEVLMRTEKDILDAETGEKGVAGVTPEEEYAYLEKQLGGQASTTHRLQSSMRSLSGADRMAYMEMDVKKKKKANNDQFNTKTGQRHALFAKNARMGQKPP